VASGMERFRCIILLAATMLDPTAEVGATQG